MPPGVHRNGTPYGDDGYNWHGLDKERYNRDGFLRFGEHRNGTAYDDDGYDGHGYDRGGFNRYGKSRS